MKHLITLVATLSSCFVLSLCLYHLFGVGIPFGERGTADFIQYWSAWQLLRQGQNPYDGALMHAVQVGVGQSSDATTMMWNPPWLPVVLAPVLSQPFEAAALTWFVCNLGLIVYIAAVTPRALGCGIQHPWVYGVGACFLPFIDCLQWGQLSIFVTAGFVTFLYTATRGRYVVSGLAVAVLTLKPHLFLLFVIPGIVWLRQIGRASTIAFGVGALMGVGGVLAVTMLIAPNALTWWVSGLEAPVAGFGVISVTQWHTATLASLLRALLSSVRGDAPAWPLWVLPCVGVVGVLFFFSVRERRVDWQRVAPGLMCIALLTASYGWLYDQSLLIVCQFSIFCASLSHQRVAARAIGIGGLIATQLAMVLTNFADISAQHYYTWVPLAFLGLLWIQTRPANQSN